MQHFWETVVAQWKQMSWVEIVASLTGLVSVWLLVKNNIWNWLWGIFSVILFGWLFWQTKLYANAGLQIFCFLPLSFYGWWAWAKFGPHRADDLPITALRREAWLGWLGMTVLLSVVIGWLMQRFTDDPAPYTDGTVTAMSIVAQYLQARKWLQNWILWIVLDVISVGYLYPSQKLFITTGLYVLFLALAIQGYVVWRVLMQKETANV